MEERRETHTRLEFNSSTTLVAIRVITSSIVFLGPGFDKR
jgi:hypothetical protein